MERLDWSRSTLLSLSLIGLIKTSLPMLKDEFIRIQGCFAASRPLVLLLNDIKLKVSLTSKLVCRLLWSTYTAKSSYLSLISCKSMTVNTGLVQLLGLTVAQISQQEL